MFFLETYFDCVKKPGNIKKVYVHVVKDVLVLSLPAATDDFLESLTGAVGIPAL